MKTPEMGENTPKTPEQKEGKMKLLDSFYKLGSDGDHNLWGNGKTIEESTRLECGWGYDPEEEDHNYHFDIWDKRDSEKPTLGSTVANKEDLLKYWNNLKKQAEEEMG